MKTRGSQTSAPPPEDCCAKIAVTCKLAKPCTSPPAQPVFRVRRVPCRDVAPEYLREDPAFESQAPWGSSRAMVRTFPGSKSRGVTAYGPRPERTYQNSQIQ